MTLEYLKAAAWIIALVVTGMLVSKALETPLQPMVLKPRVVKTINITKDDIYDAGMAQ